MFSRHRPLASIGLITHSECVESDVTGVDALKLEVDSNIDTVTDHPLQDDQEDADDLVRIMWCVANWRSYLCSRLFCAARNDVTYTENEYCDIVSECRVNF